MSNQEISKFHVLVLNFPRKFCVVFKKSESLNFYFLIENFHAIV